MRRRDRKHDGGGRAGALAPLRPRSPTSPALGAGLARRSEARGHGHHQMHDAEDDEEGGRRALVGEAKQERSGDQEGG